MSLAHLTNRLLSKIIINVSVGTAYSDTMIDYESPTGLEKIPLPDQLDVVVRDACSRLFAGQHLLFPLFCWANYVPSDLRFGRNVAKFRDVIK